MGQLKLSPSFLAVNCFTVRYVKSIDLFRSVVVFLWSSVYHSTKLIPHELEFFLAFVCQAADFEQTGHCKLGPGDLILCKD